MSEIAKGVVLRTWAAIEDLPAPNPVFMFDDAGLPENLANVSVVLRNAGRERAIELVARGAERVLIGEPALLDSTLIDTLSKEFGREKIGVWVPVRRREISWTMDMVSNSDFRMLTPSYGKESWEILMNDGSATGTDVDWWIGQMFGLGASQVLVGVDIKDDIDLNICAGLVEMFGDLLWVTPLSEPEANLLPWIRFGQARNVVVPAGQYANENRMAVLRQSLQIREDSMESDELKQLDEGVPTNIALPEKLGMAVESELPEELKLS